MTVRVTTDRLSGPSVLIPLGFEWTDLFDLSSRPLFKLALEDAHPAYSVSVEWIVDRLDGGQIKRKLLTNYTQILRQPFTPRPDQDWMEAAREAGNKILDDAELTLWYGKPRYDRLSDWPISFCGGVLHFLKRRLYENDHVSLRQLRPLMLRDYRQYEGEGLAAGEWLMEFSLQVNAGHYQRGMKPLLTAPKPEQLTNAWAQGASLKESQ